MTQPTDDEPDLAHEAETIGDGMVELMSGVEACARMAMNGAAILADRRAELRAIFEAADAGQLRDRALSEAEEEIVKFCLAYCYGTAAVGQFDKLREQYMRVFAGGET